MLRETGPKEPDPGGTEPEVSGRATTREVVRVPPSEEEPVDAATRTRTVLELIGLVIAPTTLLVALAYYFGWKLTESRAAYFGLDYSALGFSTQDYVLRSVDAFFVPLGAILFAGLVALAVSRYVSEAMMHRRRRRLIHRAALVMAVVGAVLVILGAYGALRPLPFETHYLLVPLSPGVGIVLLAYAGYIHDQLTPQGPGRPKRLRLAPGTVGVVLVCLVVVLSLFWTTSEYAAALGQGRAQRLERGLSLRPQVIIYSEVQLGLEGPGVTEEVLSGADLAYPFRYTGLRLLIRSDDKYFLLPDGWSRSSGSAIVLPDAAGLRFEFAAVAS